MIYCGKEVIKVPLYKTIQKRIHRTKRINKKWLKKYGTKIIETRQKSDKIFTVFNKILVPEEM